MPDLYHLESEQSVLGALLIDPASIDRIESLVEGDFYTDAHRTIFRAISRMLSDRKPVDAVTVAEHLISSGVSEDEIGLPYLGALASNVPSSANIVRYAEVVIEKRMRRDLLSASAQIADLAQSDATMPASQCIDEAAGIVFALSEKSERDEREAQEIGSILPAVLESIDARVQNGGEISGISTGLADLDRKTCGLHPSDLVIISGRPSMGKTALAMNIAEHVAMDGKTALIFSMEMGKESLVERCMSSIGSIDHQAIRSGRLTDDDYSRMTVAIMRMSDMKLIIDDRPALSIAQMRSRARRIARKHGLDLIVVDYIQLATGDAGKNGNREQEVSSISRGLKAIAKEFGVPVIALSQLSRKVEDRADKRPMMSDLRESGAIEQDADLILMMYRDEYYHPETSDKGIAEIIIGKQRMGETGRVMVGFQGQYSRFNSLSYDAIESIEEARKSNRESRNIKRGFD